MVKTRSFDGWKERGGSGQEHMSAKRGVVDGIAYSATASSDPESDSSLSAEGEDAVVTKRHSGCKVQKSTSLRKMKSKIKDLRSLISRYQGNEALLVSSTNVMSGEIMNYEIQLAGLYGKMKSIMDENYVLKESWESLSATERKPATPSSTDQERTLEERTLLVELKRGVSAKLKDCKSIQNTVNAKLDEINEFYEKYHGEFELKFADGGFGEGLAEELGSIKLELKNVRKNSQIKVNNLQIQLIEANKSLELLKRDIKAKDDCLKCIPDLVNKTNNALLSYKKSIANQKETIEALQNELSRQLETQGQMEAELQAQIPTNVSLIDPFDEVDPAMDIKTKELLAIQEKELQELRLQKNISDQKHRAAQLHVKRQDNTIKLLKDYLQSLIQGRQPPLPHLYSFPVEHKIQNISSWEAPKLTRATPNALTKPLLLLPQHAKHLDNNAVAVAVTNSGTKDSGAQLLLTAPPNEQVRPKDKFRFGSNFNNITRPHEFWRQQPQILDQKSPRLLLPTPPNGKLQENAKEDGLSKVKTDESTPPNTSASDTTKVFNLTDPTPLSKTT